MSKSLFVFALSLALSLLINACDSTDNSSPNPTFGDDDIARVQFEVALGNSPEQHPGIGSDPELTLVKGSGTGEFVLTAKSDDTRICYASIEFNSDEIHYVGAIGGSISPSIFIVVSAAPGVLHLGWAIPNYSEKTGPQGEVSLVKLKFAVGAQLDQKLPSTLPTEESHKANILNAQWNLDGLDLSFIEKNPGDYDCNGSVTISDIAPIADNYLRKVDSDSPDNSLAKLDGDGNREISTPDIAMIAENYSKDVNGYAIQFSTDGGSNWTPSDLNSKSSHDLLFFERTNTENVEIDIENVHSKWKVRLSREAVDSLNIPSLDPSNEKLMIRIVVGNGVEFGVISEGVKIEVPIASDTNPPAWLTTVGITNLSAVENYNTLKVEFNPASDDESAPVVYRVYYDKSESFSELVDGLSDEPNSIRYIESTLKPNEKTPYSVEIVGLEPGTSYSVIVRARDSAFPKQNFDDNDVILTETVDPSSLQIGEISVTPPNIRTGYIVELGALITGGDGVVTAFWSDSKTDFGFFLKNSMVNEGQATTQWNTSVGDTTYDVLLDASDSSGKHGKQRTNIYVADETPPLFTENIYPILKSRCMSCHSESSGSGLVFGAPEKTHATLLNTTSTQQNGYKFVKPLQVDQSYLLSKIASSNVDRQNERMPLGGPYLTENEIMLITRWIAMGALLGTINPRTIHLGTPTLLMPNTNESIDMLPVGVLGKINLPVLSAITAPLDVELELEKNKSGDAYIDFVSDNSDRSITIRAGCANAEKFKVKVFVKDAFGRSGSTEFPVTLTEKNSRILSYANDIEQIVINRCSSCHTNINPVLTEGNGYKNLVEQP